MIVPFESVLATAERIVVVVALTIWNDSVLVVSVEGEVPVLAEASRVGLGQTIGEEQAVRGDSGDGLDVGGFIVGAAGMTGDQDGGVGIRNPEFGPAGIGRGVGGARASCVEDPWSY